MSVYKYLDLSTAHLTEPEMTVLSRRPEAGTAIVPRHIPHEYGVWMHVPWHDDQDDSWQAEEDLRRVRYPNIQRCIEFAREHDCYWINFDQDADTELALPTHDW